MSQYKTCTKCGQSKQIAEFGIHRGKKSAKSGIRPACKKCESIYTKQRYHLTKETNKQKAMQWRLENPVAWKKIQKRSYESNKTNRLAEMKKWRENNQVQMRNYSSARRTRKLNAKTFLVTTQEMQKMLSKNCSYCHTERATQIDHIIPLSKGGDHSLGNLTGACKTCNLSKSSKFLMEWRKGDK